MRCVLFLLLPLLVLMTAPAQQTLAKLKDMKRVLLVFAPSEHDPRYLQQMQMLAHHEAEMQERDLILIPVLTEAGPQITPETLRVMLGPGLSDQDQTLARHRFQVAPQMFVAILLGEDGGEKLRTFEPISIVRLNRTIDAMPMRKDEIKQRQSH